MNDPAPNSPERMQQVQQVFHATLERPLPERAPYLAQVCADDAELRREVEALLAAHDDSDGFLSTPALNHDAATLLQAPAPPQTISHYQIISLLGKGGMGEGPRTNRWGAKRRSRFCPRATPPTALWCIASSAKPKPLRP
jgi:serine/threonine-protein kinase